MHTSVAVSNPVVNLYYSSCVQLKRTILAASKSSSTGNQPTGEERKSSGSGGGGSGGGVRDHTTSNTERGRGAAEEREETLPPASLDELDDYLELLYEGAHTLFSCLSVCQSSSTNV